MIDPAQDEARTLLRALVAATGDAAWLELEPAIDARTERRRDMAAWQARLAEAGAVLAEVSATLGHAVEVEAADLVEQRAAPRGLEPPSNISAGGASRLLQTRGAWIAITLGRPDDWQLTAALLGTDCPDWEAIEAVVAGADAEDLAERAGELGLAVAVVPEGDQPSDPQWRFRRDRRHGPWVITPSRPRNTRALRRVVDLSALWAGPLCASLLRRAGAEVVTVESVSRPDGARRGDPELHRLLHDGNTFVTLDFSDSAGLEELHRLVEEADVVVSAARMRALQQLGLDPFTTVEQRPGLTWVAISAYGLTGPWSNRIGYGDDTAVAGGLVLREPTPMFVADAVADPITGLYAAIAGLAVSACGGGVIDAALRDAAAHVARPWSRIAP